MHARDMFSGMELPNAASGGVSSVPCRVEVGLGIDVCAGGRVPILSVGGVFAF